MISGLVDAEYVVALLGVNTAVIWYVAAAPNDVVYVAVPDDSASGLPIAVVPFMNCTVPTAVLGANVAVNVTEVPVVVGLATLDVRVVLVDAGVPTALTM